MKRKWIRKIRQMIATVLVASLVVQLGANPELEGVTKAAEKSSSSTSTSGVELLKKDFSTNFRVTGQWKDHFQGEITLTNTSKKTIENWSMTCNFKYDIDQMWSATVCDHKGDTYQIKNADWNANIEPGASVSFSFIARWDNLTISEPSNFDLSSEKITLDGDNYKAEFSVTSDWGDGYNGNITLKNDTDKVIDNWVLSFDFDHEIDNVWNGKIIEHNKNHYIIQNAGYNKKLKKGEKIEIGFQGKPGNVQQGPYNYELSSYEDLKLELDAPNLVLDGTGEYPVLKWNKVDGSTTYTIQRKKGIDGKYSVLAKDLTAKTYTDMTIDEKGEYYYAVVAENKYTKSPLSNEECYCNLANVPKLYGKLEGTNAKLIWAKANKARSYTLYRSSNSGGPYYVIGDKLVTTEYIDKDITSDKVYYYVVVAENERGKTDYSNEIKIDGHGEKEYEFEPDLDDDGDGLTNSQELTYGTDGFSKDTDKDGLNDKKEVQLGTNPLEPDSDGDGIYDGAEVNLGMDPLKKSQMGELSDRKSVV